MDVTQEIEQRVQQAAQAGADHCTLCSISCVTSTLASVYTYGGRQLPPTCGRMGDAEPRFSNLFALQLTTFLFPYKLGFVFISLLLYSKRRAFLPSAQPKVYDCRLFVFTCGEAYRSRRAFYSSSCSSSPKP